MKIAIVGSRKYPAMTEVWAFVNELPKDTIVISGGASGVDSVAEDTAASLGLRTLIFPVAKNGLPPYPHGKAEFRKRAMARNKLIVEMADEVHAFWDGESNGTRDTIEWAKKLGKPCTVHLCDE